MKTLISDKQAMVDEIVEKVRKNSGQGINIGNNELGIKYDKGYRQPSMKEQIKIIEHLIDKGINVEVMSSAVGIVENKDKQKSLTVGSYGFMDYSKIDFGENTKTVFLYTWILYPMVPTNMEAAQDLKVLHDINLKEEMMNTEFWGEERGVIRFSTCDEGYKLIELCKA